MHLRLRHNPVAEVLEALSARVTRCMGCKLAQADAESENSQRAGLAQKMRWKCCKTLWIINSRHTRTKEGSWGSMRAVA